MDAVAAIAHWRKTDPLMAKLAQETSLPTNFDSDDAFTSLVRAIIHQQVSMAAATTIFNRLKAKVSITPEGILAASDDTLREVGLSRAKLSYVRDLADKVANAQLDLDGLRLVSDKEALAALTSVKGIGPWSAKMHLMFHMGHLDVCPWEDQGIRLAVAQFYGVPEKETTSWLKEHHAKWSPYNSIAARVLWAARRA